MQRILCPVHEEETPSCVVYHDHWRCYGCGASGPLSQLGLKGTSAISRPPPVDLPSELARIRALPLVTVRGLRLPADADSYYVVWPCGGYYKRRKFFPGDGPKYIGPRGHKKPPLWARREAGSATLVLVEGELNALSLAQACTHADVMSPGGVGDFKETLVYAVAGYTRYILVLDRDKPGLDAGQKMRNWLLKLTPYVDLHLVQPDLNDKLVNGTLREEVRSWGLGLPTRVQSG